MNKLAYALLVGAACAKDTTTLTQMEEVVVGILRGALDAEGFDDIEKCLHDGEVIVKDVEIAYEDFSSKKASKVMDGIQHVADVLKTIKSGMSDCSSLKADWKKLESMAEIFASPTSFAYHVGKDLMINGVSIFHEIEAAVTDYKQAKWGDFGYNIGEASAKLILGSQSQIQLQSMENNQQLAQIYQGIVSNYGGKFNLEALLECINEEDKALLMFNAAFQEFEKAYQQKDIQDAIGGVIAAVAGVKQFQAGLPECESIDTSTFRYEEFQQCLDIAEHPLEHFKVLEEDVLINGHSIIAAAKAAVDAYKNGDFTVFGGKIGYILSLSTKTEQKETSTAPVLETKQVENEKMVTQFAQGFFEATNVGHFSFTELLMCIYKADSSALALYKGVEELELAYKDKDLKEALVGVVETVAFVQQLRGAIPTCESVDSKSFNWTKIDNIVNVIENPVKSFEIVGKDIILNGSAITEELRESLEAFRNGEFGNFGYMLGKTMSLATETTDDNLFLY